MLEILSIMRMQGLKKLKIKAKLSGKVLKTIVRHQGLRKFELSKRNDEQKIMSIVNAIYSREYKGIIFKLNNKNISGINPELLVWAVTNLDILEISNIKLTQHQIVTILTVSY